MLKELGVIAPRILSKINRHRNELEHEYTCPDPDSVEDFVDVVALFLEATRKHIEDCMSEWTVIIPQEEAISVRTSHDGLQVVPTRPFHVKPYVEIKSGTKEYLALLRALLRSSQ